MKGCTVVFLTALLSAMASCATKATPSYAFAMLCSVTILVALKALSNIATSIEKLAVVKFAIEQEACIDESISLLRLCYPNV